MDMENYTKKSMEALKEAEKAAFEYNNQELASEHLLYGLLTVDDSLIVKLLENQGVNKDLIISDTDRIIAARPRVSGSDVKVYMSQELSRVIMAAEDEAKKMGDAYLSVEHMFLGLLDKYAGAAAAENIIEKGDSVTFVMKASGRTGWLSETEPSAVYLNGEEITDRVVSEGCLYYADMQESGETAILTIK